MPASSALSDSEVEQQLASLFEARFRAPLESRGIEVRPAARDLFLRTAMAQAEAGIVPRDKLLAAVQRLELEGLADFYLLKFGPRPLSYNRMLRLLADMHDKWIASRREPPAVQSSPPL